MEVPKAVWNECVSYSGLLRPAMRKGTIWDLLLVVCHMLYVPCNVL